MSNWKEQLMNDEWSTVYNSLNDDQKRMVNQLVISALRYPATEQIADLEDTLQRIRAIFPWHRGDDGVPDVPVLQERYDQLVATVTELENKVAWQQRKMQDDTQYLPFVRHHYWYEPERGPVMYAYEANELEKQLRQAQDEVRRLKAMHPNKFEDRI